MEKANFKIGNVLVGPGAGLFVIAGPCVMEDIETCMDIACRLRDIGEQTGIGMIFKASFDKANRSSISSYRGPGLEKGMEIFSRIREKTQLPLITDVHQPGQAQLVAGFVDALQIPAFLCRQTDLLVACGQTEKPVNVKKGQFVSPAEMSNVIDKIESTGNNKITLCERGTFFGYNRLVNDMTAIELMKDFAKAVVFDATHSTQQPGGLGDSSAGNPRFAPVLAKAAVASGANGLFMEVHTKADEALCDKACIMDISKVQKLLADCKKIFEIVNS